MGGNKKGKKQKKVFKKCVTVTSQNENENEAKPGALLTEEIMCLG